MTTTVKIAGIDVDPTDPCACRDALRAARLMLVSGSSVNQLSVQSPTTRETAIFTAADMERLDRMIDEYDRACARAAGERRHYAARIRYS